MNTKGTREPSLAQWAITTPQTNGTMIQIVQDLKQIAKKWVFQLEEGHGIDNELKRTSDTKEENKGGYRHWQIQVSLIKKSRKGGLIKLLKNTVLKNSHVSALATVNTDQFNYVMKLDTRVDGPWKDTDDIKIPEPIPDQINEIKSLHKWQSQIINDCKEYKDSKDAQRFRTINVLIDQAGSIGKSTLIAYMRYHNIAIVLPVLTEPEDMAAAVMSRPPSKAYIIDMPRSTTQKKQKGFWAGIESIKNGYCYDKRYKFQDRIFTSPCIWVFSNVLPTTEYLSTDRWKLWLVGYEMEIVPYNETRAKNIHDKHKEDKLRATASKRACPITYSCDKPFDFNTLQKT